MGVSRSEAEFLAFSFATGVRFDRTLTLGRQSRFATVASVVEAIRPCLAPTDQQWLASALAASPWADPIFVALGAAQTDSVDVSSFEGATIVHDLNLPIGDTLAGRWDCVFDGGTSEHVFNAPVALENAMRLVADGGHLIVAAPANQQMGHGFYQFSPELYFRALRPEYGFALDGVYLHTQSIRSSWFRLTDPAILGHRSTIATLGEATLFVLAKRVGPAGITVAPQQSDYAQAWPADRPPSTARTSRWSPLNRRIARSVPWLVPAMHTLRHVWRGPRGDGAVRVDLPALTRELQGRRRSIVAESPARQSE